MGNHFVELGRVFRYEGWLVFTREYGDSPDKRSWVATRLVVDVMLVNTLMAATLADDTFKYKFVDENVLISIKLSPKFGPYGPINNITELVQIMAWHRIGDKPLSEPMMVRLSTHICVTRSQWFNGVARVANYTFGSIYVIPNRLLFRMPSQMRCKTCTSESGQHWFR